MNFPVTQSNHTNSIVAAIERLRSLCQVNIQSSWLLYIGDLSIADVTASLSSWEVACVNAKVQITWEAGRKVLWLGQKLVIPHDLHGYALQGLSLKLALHWWADSAQVFVNGKLVAAGDLFDCSPRVLISAEVQPGEEFDVALRLVSPGHCDGALVKSLLVYESREGLDPGFVADELAVLLRFLEGESEKLDVLAAAVGEIDWDGLNRVREASRREDAKNAKEEFEKSLFAVRYELSSLGGLKSKIYLLGHAHLDLAWLWPVGDTWKVAQSTFESVLGLQEEFEELIFCHSTPALYAWVDSHRPDLFAAIRRAVDAGRWEVVGGFWVEPDLVLIAGESIVRQLLYGQRYVLEKFGKFCSVVWVPDSFGFCASLPQFLVDAGIEFFVTQKLRWNDTTQFDYGAFWWRSADGSEVFSLMSALIGEGIDPVKMASYSCEWFNQTGISAALWLPGVGDHGGGPTRDMLELARRWQNSPFFPQLEFSTAQKYLSGVRSQESGGASCVRRFPPLSNLAFRSQESGVRRSQLRAEVSSVEQPGVQELTQFPTWEDELYLEFHRGCYTTHAEQKLWNRFCEGLLYQAELFAALASISCGRDYPKVELEVAWKKVLFNQFHDILPGSSITQVYTDALLSWQEVERVGNEILQHSLSALAARINLLESPPTDGLPIVVFNSLNWQRSEVVSVSLPSTDRNWQVYDGSGQVPSVLADDSILLFLASDIPAVGYRVFWLVQTMTVETPQQYTDDWVMENEFLRVVVDAETGDLSSVFDRMEQREVLNGAGNQLQAWQDCGQYWDAWNIDPNYAQHPLPPTRLKSIEWLERGFVQSRVRVVRQLGNSEFRQDYILQARSQLLKIATKVDWQERQVLVKAAFPLNVEAEFASYEIPCGVIRRPTQPQTPREKAKWEVPALRWADLTGHQYGVSLLNDCKYGYDSQPNQLRLTLLRSPNWPDPQADRGIHEFTYALYSHVGGWESAHTVRRGYELNIPLQVLLVTQQQEQDHKFLSPVGSFFDLGAENLILMAFKQAEDNQQEWILRCYECHGASAELRFQSDLGLTLTESVDLLERSSATPEFSYSQQILTVKPWKITSFKVLS
ncbi:alpha-mannosidase [Iningainema tapete]|uniref:Alpha-mannosidase n=1 Tax=Iningainema tapete BLCC-T55 TaxID=2748662 RepID=A0A8J6XFW0_9CYAN|nr:alpha-mannosidase [Iningainema tapete]MBD2775044.1 alpha-mannosidase [Iningainema tapete BLCC-T55]